MKKILILSSLILAQSAFGSKARMEALGNARHLTDVQTVFDIPTNMLLLPEAMELNFGSNAIDQNTEGGMIRSLGEAKFGFFVGANDEARGSSYLGVENPFTVAYAAKAGGDMSWGVVFNYSSSNIKGTSVSTDDKTQNHMSTTASFAMGETVFNVGLTLTDKAKGDGTTDSNEMSRAPMTLGVAHKMADWTIYGDYGMDTKKVTGAEDKKISAIRLGAINQMKSEGADFFYGLGYMMTNEKQGSNKNDKTEMPVIIGVETDAASWLTLRGSVTQNLLLGGEKDTTGATTTGVDSLPHDTTVAAGMGFKFTKSMLDITLTAAGGSGDGKVNANTFGANAGFTYLF